ncbi:unnamed protein product [Medioppia subpectinata]|uniref:SGF29 C-terminal domain-containing protein n=1 Tax=Medioppia subpectinata TaxID=1979941 RepID=A0A7R9KS76_9ACAR|nr:unnamed protein product [Medioppia subpectinata]CAG2108874.1 unnamed protein product [Medioppia subpectinata]
MSEDNVQELDPFNTGHHFDDNSSDFMDSCVEGVDEIMQKNESNNQWIGLTNSESIIINEKMREFHQMLSQMNEEVNRSEHNLTNITKTHERMQTEPQKPYYKHKLKGLYKTALQDTDSESEIIRKALDLIHDIRSVVKSRQRKSGHGFTKETAIRRGALMKMLQQNAATLPLFVPKSREDTTPPKHDLTIVVVYHVNSLCGAIPAESNYAAKVGDLVAALVKGSDGDENWILAEVVHYINSSNKYEIDDIDEEQKDRHTLSRRRVLPLPLMRANPETDGDALFPKDTLVLALYPQTTCFYRAIIQEPPKTAQEEYQVLFEDSSYSDGYSPPLSVPQRYVIACKESRKNFNRFYGFKSAMEALISASNVSNVTKTHVLGVCQKCINGFNGYNYRQSRYSRQSVVKHQSLMKLRKDYLVDTKQERKALNIFETPIGVVDPIDGKTKSSLTVDILGSDTLPQLTDWRKTQLIKRMRRLLPLPVSLTGLGDGERPRYWTQVMKKSSFELSQSNKTSELTLYETIPTSLRIFLDNFGDKIPKELQEVYDNYKKSKELYFENLTKTQKQLTAKKDKILRFPYDLVSYLKQKQNIMKSNETNDDMTEESLKQRAIVDTEYDDYLKHHHLMQYLATSLKGMKPDEYEAEVEGWRDQFWLRNYGTPDPKTKPSDIECSGCELQEVYDNYKKSKELYFENLTKTQNQLMAKKDKILRFPYDLVSYLKQKQNIMKSNETNDDMTEESLKQRAIVDTEYDDYLKHHHLMQYLATSLKGMKPDEYEAEVEGWRDQFWLRNYGTPDPKTKPSDIECSGCGAYLHCSATNIPGYMPSEKFKNLSEHQLRAEKCQRCEYLAHFNVALNVNVSNDHYPELMAKIQNTKALIVIMVDLLDFPCSVWPVDLLPKDNDLYLERALQSLKKSLYENNISKESRIIDISLISAKTGFGVESLITRLLRDRLKGEDVDVDLISRATTSVWPGTTLNLIKFPIRDPTGWEVELRLKRLRLYERNDIKERRLKWTLYKETGDTRHAMLSSRIGMTYRSDVPFTVQSGHPFAHKTQTPKPFDATNTFFKDCNNFYDTPGTIYKDQILTLLTTEELLKTIPRELITPRTFTLRPFQSLFVGGLGRIDVMNARQQVWLTVFASHYLPIHVVHTEEAKRFYELYLGTDMLGVPIGGFERVQHWPQLVPREIVLDGVSWQQSCADIVLSTAGWVSVTLGADTRCVLRAFTPEGRGIYVRNPPLLPYAHKLRGKRIVGTPCFENKLFTIDDMVRHAIPKRFNRYKESRHISQKRIQNLQ